MGRLTRLYRAAPLTAIVVLGLLLRTWGLTWGLVNADVSRRPHPDEWVVYWLFHWFDRSPGWNPCPHTPNSCFFDWGAVYPYTAYLAHWIVYPALQLVPVGSFGPRADMQFVDAVLAGRVVSVMLSTATILVAYRLGRLAYGHAAGLASALLVALSGLLIQLAHFATPDSATGFLMSLTLLAVISAYRAPGGAKYAAAGIGVGAASATEYHMGLLLVPLVTAWMLGNERAMRHVIYACAAAALTFCVLNPYILLELPAFMDATAHGVRMRTVASRVQVGSRWDSYGPAWLYVVRYSLGYGIGYALTVWFALGLVRAVFRRRGEDWILLSWVAPYFVLVTLSPAKYMRYSAPLVVPLAVLAGTALIEILRRSTRAQRLGVAVIAGFAVLWSGTYDAAYAGLFSSPEPRLVVTRWAIANASRSTDVAFEGLPDGLLNLPVFVSDAGFHPCFSPSNRLRLLGTRYVMTDDYALEGPDSTRRILAFRSALQTRGRYRLVERVHYLPTFLGVRFPIDASPHDWRYPSHTVDVYRVSEVKTPPPHTCFSHLDSALRTLYVPQHAD